MKLLPGTAKIRMTVDDYEVITENGKHLGADGASYSVLVEKWELFFSDKSEKKQFLLAKSFYERIIVEINALFVDEVLMSLHLFCSH